MVHLYIIHARWCVHCVRSMPIFEELARSEKDLGVKVTLVESADLGNGRFSAIQGSVTKFPTVLLVTKDHTIEYTGASRTVDALREWTKGWKAHVKNLR